MTGNRGLHVYQLLGFSHFAESKATNTSMAWPVDHRESFRRHVVMMPRHVSRDAPPISTGSDMLAVVEEVITAASNPLNE
jgi:hypothetical protein